MEIKTLYQSLSTQAKELHTKHLPEIQERAKSLNPAWHHPCLNPRRPE